MVSATFAALAALFAAFTAIELFPFLLELQSLLSTSTSTQAATTFDGAVQVVPLLAATVALFTAVTLIHLHHAAAAVVGAGNRHLPEVVTFTLCTEAGILVFFLFVLPAGVVDDDVGALARVVGVAAIEELPAAATVAFFLGITLVIGHIRASGEGGGGGAVADIRRVPVPMDVLKRIALGAAAAVLSQIAMAALYVK